jgi:hypothetical protein
MPHVDADMAFTPSVQAAQQRGASRAGDARNFEAVADGAVPGRLAVREMAPPDERDNTLVDPPASG